LDNEIGNNYYRHKFTLYEKYYCFTVINFAQTRNFHAFLICQNVAFRITAPKFNCKMWFREKYALSSSKIRAALKKQAAGRTNFITTLKKYLNKMEVHRKAKKSASKTTARQRSGIKARLKFLMTQIFFSAKLIYKCVMDDESSFTVAGNEWKQQSYYESEDYSATGDVKFIRKTKFPAKFLLWLTVSESCISKPVLFKAGLAVNKEVYKNAKT
jgi:hypothetical protein